MLQMSRSSLNTINLFTLPINIQEKIASFLDLKDLDVLARVCKAGVASIQNLDVYSLRCINSLKDPQLYGVAISVLLNENKQSQEKDFFSNKLEIIQSIKDPFMKLNYFIEIYNNCESNENLKIALVKEALQNFKKEFKNKLKNEEYTSILVAIAKLTKNDQDIEEALNSLETINSPFSKVVWLIELTFLKTSGKEKLEELRLKICELTCSLKDTVNLFCLLSKYSDTPLIDLNFARKYSQDIKNVDPKLFLLESIQNYDYLKARLAIVCRLLKLKKAEYADDLKKDIVEYKDTLKKDLEDIVNFIKLKLSTQNEGYHEGNFHYQGNLLKPFDEELIEILYELISFREFELAEWILSNIPVESLNKNEKIKNNILFFKKDLIFEKIKSSQDKRINIKIANPAFILSYFAEIVPLSIKISKDFEFARTCCRLMQQQLEVVGQVKDKDDYYYYLIKTLLQILEEEKNTKEKDIKQIEYIALLIPQIKNEFLRVKIWCKLYKITQNPECISQAAKQSENIKFPLRKFIAYLELSQFDQNDKYSHQAKEEIERIIKEPASYLHLGEDIQVVARRIVKCTSHYFKDFEASRRIISIMKENPNLFQQVYLIKAIFSLVDASLNIEDLNLAKPFKGYEETQHLFSKILTQLILRKDFKNLRLFDQISDDWKSHTSIPNFVRVKKYV